MNVINIMLSDLETGKTTDEYEKINDQPESSAPSIFYKHKLSLVQCLDRFAAFFIILCIGGLCVGLALALTYAVNDALHRFK